MRAINAKSSKHWSPIRRLHCDGGKVVDVVDTVVDVVAGARVVDVVVEYIVVDVVVGGMPPILNKLNPPPAMTPIKLFP